jgi:alanine racemase
VATATINLKALEHNLSRLRSYLRPETKALAAVKADAYGHGAATITKHLEKLGVRWFGVATAGEALELRRAGVTGRILIFSPVYAGLEELLEHNVTLTIADERSLEVVRRAAGAGEARVHLKVDTGMGRLGKHWQGAAALARAAVNTPGIILEGVWTHFACADAAERAFTERQLAEFHCLLAALAKDGLEPLLKHAANSSAIIAYPGSHFDLVRPGIALHGYHSSPVTSRLEPNLIPTLTLTAPVTFIKRVKAGTPVSYGALWTAPQGTTVATVRIGYADGYPRGASNKGQVRVHGELRPIVGRVCMDQLMVDVGELDVQVGDEVALFGPGGPTAEEVGTLVGTISYEVLTGLGSRVERVYREA